MAVILQYLTYFLIASSALSTYRVLVGPSVADRMLGLNLVGAHILALLVVISTASRHSIYLDVALVYDIFGFIGILAIARYLKASTRKDDAV
jgi:multicomponent Na+:H+ antiporter subunit F